MDSLLSLIAVMPAAASADASGDSGVMAYRLGLEGMPEALLQLAIKRALQDDERVFRPTPNELRRYVRDDLAECQRRLEAIRNIIESPMESDPPEAVPPAPQPMSAEEKAELDAETERLMRRFRINLHADRDERQSAEPLAPIDVPEADLKCDPRQLRGSTAE